MVPDVRRTSEHRSRPDVFYKCERGTQTNVVETRDDTVDCKPIQRFTFSGQVDQATIFDAYTQQKKKSSLTSESKVKESTFQMNSSAQPENVKNLVYNLRVLERMVCQNQLDDILMDYVVWNDPADEYRQHGSLYPLWRIKHTEVRARHLPVSCIEWSNSYMDLLYIGYGSSRSQKMGGAILLFSLKNTTYPEYIIVTASPVLALHVHPKKPNVICAGFLDGSVAVYTLKNETQQVSLVSLDNQRGFILNEDKEPSDSPAWSVTQTPYHSMNVFSKLETKHYDSCWHVAWQPKPSGTTMEFRSLGADGRIISWFLESEKLVSKELMTLEDATQKSSSPLNESEHKVLVSDKAALQKQTTDITVGGCCMTRQSSPRIILLKNQHKKPEELRFSNSGTAHEKVAIGTTTGAIFVFANASAAQAEWVWSQAHQLPVSDLQWNPIVVEVLMSCSADWTVKFWTLGNEMALLVLDLFDPVMDVAWAPYSSSVFATLTFEGRVEIYDLMFNKTQPIAAHQIGCAKFPVKGTKLSFNPILPLLFVGDSRGDVITLKLSPNLILRRVLSTKKQLPTEEKNQVLEEERKKLRKLINLDALYVT
ncbi:dynein intermediate chain 1 axonemal [Clonorchis sinensis]|uniref:Dynein intermediate chain 1 axonemal n=1 Tax=Clonorchis sinensis TaxID=79923 RepID=G7YDJ1_CLOSI|nr:dynein intermediate chain 1 axonemal [Clonorchis sinensis]